MLREAVQACQAADTASAGSPLHALCLTNLGSALQMLAGQAGDIGVVERAVAAHRAAVAGTLAGDPYLARRMANLGSALETLSGWTGDVGPLREAAGSLRGAVAATEAGQPGRADYLSSLGAALQRLFEATMETAALTEAVNASRAAVTATPAADGDRARRLCNLGSVLRALAERMSDVRLLDEAVDVHLDAVTASPPGHPDRAPGTCPAQGTPCWRSPNVPGILYRHPDLLSQVHLAQERPAAAGNGGPAASRASLQADLANAQGQVARQAARVRRLEAKLSQMLGEQAWCESGLGTPEDIDALRRRISELEQTVVELNRKLEECEEELDAARAANREMITPVQRRPAQARRPARRVMTGRSRKAPGWAVNAVLIPVDGLPEHRRVPRADRRGHAAAAALDRLAAAGSLVDGGPPLSMRARPGRPAPELAADGIGRGLRLDRRRRPASPP